MKILENKLINKAELARLVWPNQKEPRNYLAQRISHIRGRKLSEKDIKTIKTELKEFAENLLNQLENEDII